MQGRPGARCRGTVVAWLLAAALAGCGAAAEDRSVDEPVLSLLAVGDTGEEPGMLGGTQRQDAVARAMVASDRADPVDAIVLLGDNFYPDGLREREFKERLRVNLVQPYCHFLAFTGRGEGSLAPHCPVPEAERNPVPMLAVLGNHDYGERESPLLQHKRIPEYLEGWRMPDTQDVADVVELPGGVSVVLLQSEEVRAHGASTAPLVAALQRARGPWRIVAAHHPIADPGDGYPQAYARTVREAIEAAGVTVQLFLAGHEHNLQAVAPDGGEGLPLVIVSGGGYEARPLSGPAPDRLFAVASAGFARVDVLAGPEGGRLEVELVAVQDPLATGVRAEHVAGFAVAPDGRFRPLAAEGEEPARAAR